MPTLTEILEDIREDIEGDDIALGEVVERFEDRGFGPLLLVPALLAVLPTGAIPGVPAICALFIILVSGQILFGKSHPWIPKRLQKFSVPKEKFKSGFEKVRPWTERFDELLSKRLEIFTRETATRVVALFAIILALIMIPLEAVPFACAIPGLSIGFFAIGLAAKDGLFTLFALLVGIGALWITYHFWPW